MRELEVTSESTNLFVVYHVCRREMSDDLMTVSMTHYLRAMFDLNEYVTMNNYEYDQHC